MLERLATILIAVGVAAMCQPFWPGGFRVGFFITLVATILFIVASHIGPAAAGER